MFFKHFASKNQLPGFYISGTLVENGLKLETKFDDHGLTWFKYLRKKYSANRLPWFYVACGKMSGRKNPAKIITIVTLEKDLK